MSGGLPAVRGGAPWVGSSRFWRVYHAVVWAVTLALVLVGGPLTGVARPLAAGLLALALPWYLLLGHRVLDEEGADQRRSLVYFVGLLALFLPAATLNGEARTLAFALIPQCFTALPPPRAAVAATVVSLVPVTGWALTSRPTPSTLYHSAGAALATLVFSVTFGAWIVRIVTQSRERAELIAELEASRSEAARLSAAHGALAERERFAREIHDTLAQGFTSLLMLTQAVEAELDDDPAQARRHLELMARTARENLAEARALVAGGTPAGLDGSSLADALRRLAERHGAVLSLSGAVRALPAGVEVVALRACQEALANAFKHGGEGARCSVTVDYGGKEVVLRVADDGRGFDPQEPTTGYGLAGMRARAAEVGGTVRVVSGAGRGTDVTVRLPAPDEEGEDCP
jgi:signal transduction histidine kinase